MQFAIRNRFSGAVQFTAEIDPAETAPESTKIGLAVRWAKKVNAHLTGTDLRGADLKYAELKRADLRGADLTGANLRRADLPRANLAGAVLANANLTEANLLRADLAGADLGGANLNSAALGDANFGCANLARANLAAYVVRANLAGANLTDAYLGGANLTRANLADADLARANLTYADFTSANLAGANLAGAELANATLARANLANANLAARNLDLAGSLRIAPDEIPVIPDIDAAILAAIEAGGQLGPPFDNGTTRDRADWAIHLAGQKGQALKEKVGPATAGALIYRASRPGKGAPWLSASREEAMEDIRRCAAEQSGQPARDPMTVALAAHRAAASELFAVRDSYNAMFEAATEPESHDCDAAESKMQSAAEAMLAAEKKLDRMALATADGMAALKRLVERSAEGTG